MKKDKAKKATKKDKEKEKGGSSKTKAGDDNATTEKTEVVEEDDGKSEMVGEEEIEADNAEVANGAVEGVVEAAPAEARISTVSDDQTARIEALEKENQRLQEQLNGRTGAGKSEEEIKRLV